MIASPSICLASASPRRRLMLQQAGFEIDIRPSDLDDALLVRQKVSPRQWVMALAWFKARRVAVLLSQKRANESPENLILLGADTLCAYGDELLGQPRDAEDARRMLLLMRNTSHHTITGICLLSYPQGKRFLGVDGARVKVGAVTEKQIDQYVASGQWRGKAGAYNLSERLESGWPISCEGDPATVMGLPMLKLPGWIRRFRQRS